MQRTPARTERADQPPSTPGTSERRAPRWPLWAGIVAIAAIAVAAPMVAADPETSPVQTTATVNLAATPARAVEATTTTTDPGPTQAEIDRLNVALWTNKVTENRWIERTKELEAAEAARQAEEARKAEAAKAEAAKAAAAPVASSGRCGGNLPPCWVMQRESGGSLTARNPSSSASGKWQFLDSTWAGYGGYASAWMAPESVQDAKAAQLWAGGSGCGHWSAC